MGFLIMGLAPRSGRTSNPQPTVHIGPFTQSQWITDVTRAAMPGQVCKRYILSRPPNQASGQRGRSARIIAMLMQPIARTPLSCTILARSGRQNKNGQGAPKCSL